MTTDQRERGAIVPLTALCMVVIITVVAIVIDLGATRSFRRDARAAADSGATSGALNIKDTTGTAKQCTDAMAYTFLSLGGTQPSSSSISTACTGMTGACGTAIRTATLTVDSTTVTVTNPVVDGSSLMDGTSLGTGVSQPANATTDGLICDRVGVEITRPQPSFFRGVLPGTSGTYTVHSVARYTEVSKEGNGFPALVALNQSACKAIDAGNGDIYLIGNSRGPGIAISDSNGPSCSSGNPIISGGSSGQVCAQSSGAVPGELHWFEASNAIGYGGSAGSVYSSAPTTCGSSSLSGYRYVGQMSFNRTRTTRVPVDRKYHCTNVPTSIDPLCTTTDPIAAFQALLSATPLTSTPTGYALWTGACDSSAAAVTFPSGKVFVNCPTFTVKTNALNIPGGSTVLFNGALSVEAGGFLKTNTSGTADSSGYPVPTDTALQTTLIINSTAANAFNMQSSSANIALAQTTVFSKGGMTIGGSPVIRWTPPTSPEPSAGGTKALIYWSESTQQFALSGSPSIFAKGIFFHGNGKLFVSGGGLIDLTNVQMWVDSIGISGGGGVRLSSDPENSVSTSSAGTALIR